VSGKNLLTYFDGALDLQELYCIYLEVERLSEVKRATSVRNQGPLYFKI